MQSEGSIRTRFEGDTHVRSNTLAGQWPLLAGTQQPARLDEAGDRALASASPSSLSLRHCSNILQLMRDDSSRRVANECQHPVNMMAHRITAAASASLGQLAATRS